jgi:hypothetical protein
MFLIAVAGLACAAAAFVLWLSGFEDRQLIDAIDRGISAGLAAFHARPIYCERTRRWRDRRTMRFVKAPV